MHLTMLTLHTGLLTLFYNKFPSLSPAQGFSWWDLGVTNGGAPIPHNVLGKLSLGSRCLPSGASPTQKLNSLYGNTTHAPLQYEVLLK